MYKDVRSKVRVGNGFSEELCVVVGVHQGSVVSRLLLIIVLEAPSRVFNTSCPLELLYATDLMTSDESIEELLVKLKKSEMEKNAHQPQSAGSDRRLDVFNMRETCDAPLAETWAMTEATLNPRFDSVMSRQIFVIKNLSQLPHAKSDTEITSKGTSPFTPWARSQLTQEGSLIC